MFIHIGNNNIIRSREIISIVDHDIITSSSIMEKMINDAKKKKKLIKLTSVTKSVIITNSSIYFSSLSVPTLKKRSSISAMIDKFENHTKDDE